MQDMLFILESQAKHLSAIEANAETLSTIEVWFQAAFTEKKNFF